MRYSMPLPMKPRFARSGQSFGRTRRITSAGTFSVQRRRDPLLPVICIDRGHGGQVCREMVEGEPAGGTRLACGGRLGHVDGGDMVVVVEAIAPVGGGGTTPDRFADGGMADPHPPIGEADDP